MVTAVGPAAVTRCLAPLVSVLQEGAQRFGNSKGTRRVVDAPPGRYYFRTSDLKRSYRRKSVVRGIYRPTCPTQWSSPVRNPLLNAKVVGGATHSHGAGCKETQGAAVSTVGTPRELSSGPRTQNKYAPMRRGGPTHLADRRTHAHQSSQKTSCGRDPRGGWGRTIPDTPAPQRVGRGL